MSTLEQRLKYPYQFPDEKEDAYVAGIVLVENFAKKIHGTLESGGDSGQVGQDIQAFADKHGDDLVCNLADHLLDIDLSSILRHYDQSFPTPIFNALNPQRFASIVEFEHLHVRHGQSESYTPLYGLITGVLLSDEKEDDLPAYVMEMVHQPHAIELPAGMINETCLPAFLELFTHTQTFDGGYDDNEDADYGSDRHIYSNVQNARESVLARCMNWRIPLNIDVVRGLADDMNDMEVLSLGGDIGKILLVLRKADFSSYLDLVTEVLRKYREEYRRAKRDW